MNSIKPAPKSEGKRKAEDMEFGDIAWPGWSPLETQRRVEHLLNRYVECLADDALEQWPDFFVADACRYEIITRENTERGMPLAIMLCTSHGMLVDRVVSLRQANIYPRRWFRHLLSNVVIHGVDDSGLTVHSSFVVFQTRNSGETTIFSAGKYVDRIVLADGQLKFADKRVILDTHRVDTLLVNPL
jgi:anthranilate 1,2-dioxygenase small subunit